MDTTTVEKPFLSSRTVYLWALVLLFVIAVLPRTLALGAILSPDEPRWYQNTLGFKEGLTTGDLTKLYQQPHPGITTMWLSVLTVDADSWAVRRLPIAIASALLIVGAGYLAIRLWGIKIGFTAGLLLALNPLLIAHSRVVAMDALLALFLLISVLSFLLWIDKKKIPYVIVSAVAAALAVLSKIAGVVIVPFIGVLFLIVMCGRFMIWRNVLKATLLWGLSFIITMIVVLPTLVTHFTYVWAGTQEFFATEHFQQAVHALGPWWYPQALLLWSTLLHLLALIPLIAFPIPSRKVRWHLVTIAAFALLFFLAMQFSIKKGDRYLLPSFLFFDVATAIILWHTLIFSALGNGLKKYFKKGILAVACVALVWQLYTVISLHPYALAYRNPLFRSVAHGRTMGWGEGLDLAAHYLNTKPDAQNMLVIAYYEASFQHQFKGTVTSAERLAKESAQDIGGRYVVLYRTMEGRAADRWETKVLADFAHMEPEHTIVLNGEEYAWIYRITKP